jgi:hypothetical protein
VESLAEDFKLSACGRQPPHYSLCYLILFVHFVFVFHVLFRSSVCHSSLGERSYVMPDLHHSSGIVFLYTLGTMYHFSLGVW